jgi:hypothetical protein
MSRDDALIVKAIKEQPWTTTGVALSFVIVGLPLISGVFGAQELSGFLDNPVSRLSQATGRIAWGAVVAARDEGGEELKKMEWFGGDR